MPVTLNSGFQMPSWFDLLSLDPAGKEDEVGIKKAHQLVEMLIEEEVKAGIPSERIMLALYMQAKTGGVIALSSWAPLHRHSSSS